jgi:hypothetical protein
VRASEITGPGDQGPPAAQLLAGNIAGVKEAKTMQTTLTPTVKGHMHLSDLLFKELDLVLDGLLAPFAIDFSHMDWGSQRDETYM